MTHQELIENIGTIGPIQAPWISSRRSPNPKQRTRWTLIGQFGVGFYSSFMVAEEIHVHTKHFAKGKQRPAVEIPGWKRITIEDKGKKQRGTRIELFLKRMKKSSWKKKGSKPLLIRHSKFVPFPITLEGDPIESVDAIWTQPKSSLEKKDYQEFYKFFLNQNEDPETYLQFFRPTHRSSFNHHVHSEKQFGNLRMD